MQDGCQDGGERISSFEGATREMDLKESERETLREELHDKRDHIRKASPRRLIFFGDGTFSCTMKGNPSIPKKKLLKRLSVQGPTILIDEYRTSKQCPCGQSELFTPSTSSKDGSRSDPVERFRVRVHKTDGGECDILRIGNRSGRDLRSPRVIKDRDELACMNMLLIAESAIKHSCWPSHLCRASPSE